MNTSQEKSLEQFVQKTRNQTLYEELATSASSSRRQGLRYIGNSLIFCAYEGTLGAIIGASIGNIGNKITGENTIPLLLAALVGAAITVRRPVNDFLCQIGLYRNNGDQLMYNPDKSIVLRTSDYDSALKYHFFPLEELQQPYLLNAQKKEAAIMDVIINEVSDKGNIASLTMDDCELVARLDIAGINGYNEGKGIIQRIGQREFKVLAFAPYDSFT